MAVRVKRVKKSGEESVVPESCPHYWLMETAVGRTSRGVCKWCGEEREFLNVLSEYTPPVTRDKNPLGLPDMKQVKFDETQNSS